MADLEKLAGTVMQQVRSRLELLSVEWQEEKLRLKRGLLAVLLVLFFLQLGVLLVVLGFVVAWWDSPSRLLVIGAAAVFAFGAAALAFRALRGGLHEEPKLFHATINELRRDEQLLHKDHA